MTRTADKRQAQSFAALVSRRLAEGDFRPLPSGTSREREGLRVRPGSTYGTRTARVVADYDSEREAAQAADRAMAILVSAGFLVDYETRTRLGVAHDDSPNPIVSMAIVDARYVARRYRDGMHDAVELPGAEGNAVSLSPGFESFDELLKFLREEDAKAGAEELGIELPSPHALPEWSVTVTGFGQVRTFRVQADTREEAERNALLSVGIGAEASPVAVGHDAKGAPIYHPAITDGDPRVL